jgi:hypothetical protein
MKTQSKKQSISKFEGLEIKQMRKIFGGETTPTSNARVINVGNTIVDDLNGLIR